MMQNQNKANETPVAVIRCHLEAAAKAPSQPSRSKPKVTITPIQDMETISDTLEYTGLTSGLSEVTAEEDSELATSSEMLPWKSAA